MVNRFFKHTTELCLCVSMAVLLSSCSSMKRKDGPPNFYVDETKIPNAVPKPEPLSKLGNMRSYKVFGQRYYTLHSSKNFVQVGVASWYGTSFHERRTSSGEPYDMLAMTAAHKTLPLPTYLEVTNLRNHRQIIVKVNDRGPFASDRIIDLSYVAAKKLGMIGHGTTKVRIKAINPYTYGENILTAGARDKANASASKKSRPCSKGIYLQAGAFPQLTSAKKMKARLARSVKWPLRVVRKSGSRSYMIQIGPIKDMSAANKVHKHIQTLGLKSNKSYGV